MPTGVDEVWLLLWRIRCDYQTLASDRSRLSRRVLRPAYDLIQGGDPSKPCLPGGVRHADGSINQSYRNRPRWHVAAVDP
jgi:hypothetical protein